ncbi:helix-turn-helix domain-containing protein [Vibrio sp. LaRot3]|uniref:helix-turn-helix domain-containing protein n=1 Tax=Vibrio sp. LaRot3 TaxID=2998829 RepID=UPI0022CE3075|nr:helix-turn-helix transcriptional regulator [Vibrio sp. LaRot3]MDA0148228.1 helix-turn-helix transcriptional regulator [Vibrio sp. LaRot3]
MDDKLLQQVCELLKKELRRQRVGYKDLGLMMDLSEVSVKRLLNNQQPLSLQRLITICQILSLTLSKLLDEAERNLNSIPLFTAEQDAAFFAQPALFTFWSKLAEELSVAEVAELYQLSPASVHLYLSQLDKLELIELGLNNHVKLLAPAHTAFDVGSKYAAFFTHDVVNRLKERVIELSPDDDQGFLVSLKAELTFDEFQEIRQTLEEWLFAKLRDSQNKQARKALVTKPHTFVMMGAQGAYHDDLPTIPNIAPELLR